MKKVLPFILLIAGITLIVIGAIGFYRFNFTNGGDKITACTEEAKICPDGSAVGRQGPSCEFAPCPKTSPIYDKTKEDIQTLFIAKYPKYAKTLEVSINKEVPGFARGQISFAPGQPGGGWLAYKKDGAWKIAWEGNGEISCDLEKYGFPADFLTDCAKSNTTSALPPEYLSQMDSCTSDGGSVERKTKDMGSWTAISSWQCVCASGKTFFGSENLACNTWFTLIAD